MLRESPTHMIEAIPSGAVPIPDDDFVRWARDNLFDSLDVGDQAVTGAMSLVTVTQADMETYSEEFGAEVSDVSDGSMAIVTDSLGFVYGYQSTDPRFEDKLKVLADTVDSRL